MHIGTAGLHLKDSIIYIYIHICSTLRSLTHGLVDELVTGSDNGLSAVPCQSVQSKPIPAYC